VKAFQIQVVPTSRMQPRHHPSSISISLKIGELWIVDFDILIIKCKVRTSCLDFAKKIRNPAFRISAPVEGVRESLEKESL